MRGKTSGFVLGAIGLVVLAGAVWLMRPSSSTAVDPAAQTSPTYQVGLDSIPNDSLSKAMDFFNGHLCFEGSLDTVALAGTSTKGDLDALLPRLGVGASWKTDPATPVYAVVLTGRCMGGDDGSPDREATQGYMLFEDSGHMLFGRVWWKGLEPHIQAPFGEETDQALYDDGSHA